MPTIERARARDIVLRVVSQRDLPAVGEQLVGETCLSVGFGLLFPPAFLASVAACLNVHGTLLPDYPGARSLNWVIECGERASGVTVHLVDEGVDTGPILLQRAFPLTWFDTGKSLARKTLAFEPMVVVEALAQFERTGAASARAQDLSRIALSKIASPSIRGSIPIVPSSTCTIRSGPPIPTTILRTSLSTAKRCASGCGGRTSEAGEEDMV